MASESLTSEDKRLDESDRYAVDWKKWGCYVSERAWGTVREDYSPDGSAWDYFPFERSHLKAYRWNEDAIAGICDRKQNLCFGLVLWNEADAILKERFFGVSGPKGVHGEDVKEYYFYLDNTPTHSYMKFLYKYPQGPFPYERLYAENAHGDKSRSEFELIDTGIFDEDMYFDVLIEYAKADAEDICIRITATNRGPEAAPLHLLPTIWFRNTWSWIENAKKPILRQAAPAGSGLSTIEIESETLGPYRFVCEGSSNLLFTENETNFEAIGEGVNSSGFVKDGINNYVVNKERSAINPEGVGTKASAHYVFMVPPNGSAEVCLRLCDAEHSVPLEHDPFVADCRVVIDKRRLEADEFYGRIIPGDLSPDSQNVMRQSLAGMLWSKQFYNYVVKDWLEGDPVFPPPPASRLSRRNHQWTHLYNEDVLSMPDKWEYPWYASWDLAFHCIPLALLDPGFAKRQLIRLLREWYMHPNGQIPAYEWAFDDVNPPVHAWAALRVYRIEAKRKGVADRDFLEKIFHKLMLNFTWWVNRKDDEGNNVFEGGFLGLDNIGVFDRSKELQSGGHLEQSDGTSWMAMFSLNMMAIALELAVEDNVYEDVASKFFEHFVYISDAMNNLGNKKTELWNERDGFYYDVLHLNGEQFPIKLRSLVGLIPLLAVETLENEWLDKLPDFKRRTEWFLENRPDLTGDIACLQTRGREKRRLLSLVDRERLRRVLKVMLSENEFLSDHGIRSLSHVYRANPFVFDVLGTQQRVAYEPAESRSEMFGGNSNWRGPVWFPINYLLIEALQKFDYFYGDEFKVEFPTGSGEMLDLWQVSQKLEERLCKIFLQNEDGRRPVYGRAEKFQSDPHWRDSILFYEYFHGDNGSGLGASHQTGWTGLIGKILQQVGEYAPKPA